MRFHYARLNHMKSMLFNHFQPIQMASSYGLVYDVSFLVLLSKEWKAFCISMISLYIFKTQEREWDWPPQPPTPCPSVYKYRNRAIEQKKAIQNTTARKWDERSTVIIKKTYKNNLCSFPISKHTPCHLYQFAHSSWLGNQEITSGTKYILAAHSVTH